jgi:hypothetical protein
VLSPEVLSAAAALLNERGVALALDSPFDSETDYLIGKIAVERASRGEPDEVQITCTASDADETLQMLTALVDAYLATAKNALPASDGVASEELEIERRQLAGAIQRQERAIVTQAEQLQMMKEADDDAAGAGDDPQALEAALNEVRGLVQEAQKRLDEARRDLERKLPAEVVAARLAESPARTKILDRLNLARLTDDLHQQEALRLKWSSVYGRNHPQMIEIQGKIEQLKQQVAGLPVESQAVAAAVAASTPLSLVLTALESELAQRTTAENEIEMRLAARLDRLNAQQELEMKLGEARQELAFLHGEHDRLRYRADGARHTLDSRLPSVIEPPTLSPDPIAPQAGLQMAVSCVAGMALYLLLLWQIRTRLTSPPEQRPAPKTPAPAARRQRFRSQEEQQLARLKMLSAHG